MFHPVIHKTDIGKVKTSKNVMTLLKLLLTVIVKHPVVPGVFSFDIIRSVFKVYGHNQIVSWNEYLPTEPKIIYPCL